ncbi:MAG: hypothetical protein LBV35_02205 [Acinetobacter sp.]|jgi:hypothetical protein|uniref:J517_1871 family lipoprotein n=1 Tax=Acinetobacter sp. TaxID=472 RepID=UPI0028476388|nr:J517_1871 family lipoprotein [Acinetobacter sp.]MDR3027252.1 hypothetical protein [Acinetobacter sp.]
MKKLFIPALITIIGLSGCTTTANFFELKPSTMEYSGNWTGAHQNVSVATLKIKQDGTGIICQDYSGIAKIVAIKKVQDKIYTQDGSFWKIKNINSDNMELAYGMGGSYFLKKDDNFSLTTPACLEKLK